MNAILSVLKWFHGMAKGVGARTVLEGVESPGELALAYDIGFDCVQGFLLSRPLYQRSLLGDVIHVRG